jgi:hypothetical protein
MTIYRRLFWRLAASCQYRNPEANEPSEAGYALIRLGALAVLRCGGMLLFGGNWQALFDR